jgi:hypothetical protein
MDGATATPLPPRTPIRDTMLVPEGGRARRPRRGVHAGAGRRAAGVRDGLAALRPGERGTGAIGPTAGNP